MLRQDQIKGSLQNSWGRSEESAVKNGVMKIIKTKKLSKKNPCTIIYSNNYASLDYCRCCDRHILAKYPQPLSGIHCLALMGYLLFYLCIVSS